MKTFSNPHTTSKYRLLLLFTGVWVLLNALQAAYVGVDADEAYYWVYAQHLQWGYFDHPPVVALSIWLGEHFGHGPFFTRLVTVLLSGGTMYFGFFALPETLQQVKWYLLFFASVTLFHVYGFITTPDAALLFFTTVFFYAYRLFLQKSSITNTLLLAIAMTGLLYSKYHGVLPIFFTLLSNIKLVRKPAAWAAALLAFLLFTPHLYWEYQQAWPTFQYHLSERISSRYTIWKTLNYAAGQLFIWGPFTIIPALYLFVKNKSKAGTYERAHLFTFWGVLVFFFISSFRSNIEVHWTLVAGPSFLVLLLGVLRHATEGLKKMFAWLAAITVLLIVVIRILFLLPDSPVKKLRSFDDLAYAQKWSTTLHSFAHGLPVVFIDSYRLPALYRYYHPAARAQAYNTVKYRKTQFNLYNDAPLNNKTVVLAGTTRWAGATHFFKTPYDTLFLQRLDGFKAINGLKLQWLQPVETIKQHATIELELYNSGTDTINARNLSISYTFLKTRKEQYTPAAHTPLQPILLPPQFKTKLSVSLIPPKEGGPYRLLFSIVQSPFDGTFASPYYEVVVAE